jgi:rhodanese-related sulfurtransferase
MSAILAAIAIFAATTADRTPIEFTKDSIKVVKQNVAEEKAVLVDVRSKEEWEKGHLKDSIFLPSTAIRKRRYPEELTELLPDDKILYTFCVVGMRAKKAAAALVKQGYEVRTLKPGYDELIEAGFSEADNEDSRQRNAR